MSYAPTPAPWRRTRSAPAWRRSSYRRIPDPVGWCGSSLPDGSTRTPAGQPALPPVSEDAGRVAQGASADLMESNDSDDDGYLIYTLRAGDGAVQVARAADDSPINRVRVGHAADRAALRGRRRPLSGGPWRGPGWHRSTG